MPFVLFVLSSFSPLSLLNWTLKLNVVDVFVVVFLALLGRFDGRCLTSIVVSGISWVVSHDF